MDQVDVDRLHPIDPDPSHGKLFSYDLFAWTFHLRHLESEICFVYIFLSYWSILIMHAFFNVSKTVDQSWSSYFFRWKFNCFNRV